MLFVSRRHRFCHITGPNNAQKPGRITLFSLSKKNTLKLLFVYNAETQCSAPGNDPGTPERRKHLTSSSSLAHRKFFTSYFKPGKYLHEFPNNFSRYRGAVCPGFGSAALTTEEREGYFECFAPPSFTAAPKAHASSSSYLSLCRDYVCAFVRPLNVASDGKPTLAARRHSLLRPLLLLLCSSRSQPSVQVWDSPMKEVHHV